MEKKILDKDNSEIFLASNLLPCQLASKLYNRKSETEIFEKLARQRMSCIVGVAGVGKSTLAIKYGYHRKDIHYAKVFYLFQKFQKFILNLD